MGSNSFLSRETKNALVSCLRFIPDEPYLKIMYRVRMGKKLDLNNPTTYNEKLQWLKLNDRKPKYTMMVDKYEAKNYIKTIIGDAYTIPTLGVWDSFDDIDFSVLPNQFVLKCTHDSGGLVICKDKETLDVKKARKKINRSLKTNFYWVGREWPYKNVKPRIIAEPYMHDDNVDQLTDYKIHTFNGTAKTIFVKQNAHSGEGAKSAYFDRNFNHLGFTWGYSQATHLPELPKSIDEMISVAETLAKGMIELRVDFYEIAGKPYVGELTFFDGSGFDKFEPKSWDYTLGSWLKLPNKMDQK